MSVSQKHISLERPENRRRSAFSLVELLIVMTLLTLIVLALMQVFSSTQRAFRASVTQTDVLESGRAVAELISSDLRRAIPSYGSYGTNINFSVADNNYLSAAIGYLPLHQRLPGSTEDRVNALQYIFVLGKENTRWVGIGYVVNATNQSPYRPLYRFYAEANDTVSPRTLFNLFENNITQGRWSNTNMSLVADGVVHLVVRPHDVNGIWLTNGYTFGMVPPTNSVFFYPPINGEVGAYFYSNAVPASVELEFAKLEDRVLQRVESLPTFAARTNYLAGQSGGLHVFRQIVPIPNVDRAAYQ